MAWPHLEKAKQQCYNRGIDIESPGRAKEEKAKNTRRRDLVADIRYTRWAGHNWRGLLRTIYIGEKL